MARIPWVFEDLVDNTVEFMALNPNEGASPTFLKTLNKVQTTTGRTLIQEGQDQPQAFRFSGAILTEAHYMFLLRAWEKRHLVRLTDDLGRTFTIYMETFEPSRIRSATYPWRHTYQASAMIVT